MEFPPIRKNAHPPTVLPAWDESAHRRHNLAGKNRRNQAIGAQANIAEICHRHPFLVLPGRAKATAAGRGSHAGAGYDRR